MSSGRERRGHLGGGFGAGSPVWVGPGAGVCFNGGGGTFGLPAVAWFVVSPPTPVDEPAVPPAAAVSCPGAGAVAAGVDAEFVAGCGAAAS